MAIITSYSTLQSELKSELDRSDDTSSPWTRFIDNAESRLKRDRRVRRLVVDAAYSVGAETVNLPTGFAELVGLTHDGDTYYHNIDIVAPDMLPMFKARDGTPGVPTHAMIINDSTLKFSPVPDQTYTLELTYWQTIESLGGAVLSNWLLDDHPDIYLAACVVEAAKYLRDTEKFQEAHQDMDRKLEELHRDTQRRQYAGTMTRVPANPMA